MCCVLFLHGSKCCWFCAYYVCIECCFGGGLHEEKPVFHWLNPGAVLCFSEWILLRTRRFFYTLCTAYISAWIPVSVGLKIVSTLHRLHPALDGNDFAARWCVLDPIGLVVSRRLHRLLRRWWLHGTPRRRPGRRRTPAITAGVTTMPGRRHGQRPATRSAPPRRRQMYRWRML